MRALNQFLLNKGPLRVWTFREHLRFSQCRKSLANIGAYNEPLICRVKDLLLLCDYKQNFSLLLQREVEWLLRVNTEGKVPGRYSRYWACALWCLTFPNCPRGPGRWSSSSCRQWRWMGRETGSQEPPQSYCRSVIRAPSPEGCTAAPSAGLAAGYWASQEYSSEAWPHAASWTPHGTRATRGAVSDSHSTLTTVLVLKSLWSHWPAHALVTSV